MNPEQLQFLKAQLDTLKSFASKHDFLEFSKSLTNLILKAQTQVNERNEKLNKELMKLFDNLSANTSKGNKKEIDTLIDDTTTKLNTLFKEQKDALDFIRDKVRNLKEGEDGEDGQDGTDGKDADPKDVVPLVLKEIKMPEIKDYTGTLDELKKEIDELKRRPVGKMGGGKKITSVRSHNLSSQVNGVTKTFSMPMDTLKVLGVWGTQFPVTFNEGTDWTFNGRVLTLTDEVGAPETGQTLFALIETAFYG